jgi:hypothetical protein
MTLTLALRREAVLGMVAMATGLAFMAVIATAGDSRQDKILAEFESKTGLKPVQIPDTGGAYLGKIHRGYSVLYTAKAGNVWGRYAARLTMGEIGKEVGGLLGFLTGQYSSGVGGVTGSPREGFLSGRVVQQDFHHL